MKITIAAPFSSAMFRNLTGVALDGAPPGQGGIPSTTLAAGLLQRGHDVTIVTLDGEIESPITIDFQGGRVIYCPIRTAPQYRARDRALDLFEHEIRLLTDAIRQASSDIVHAHWTYEFAEAAVRSACPHLVTMHDLGWDCFWQFKDPYRLARLIMKYRTMPRVRHLSVVSPYMASKAWQYGYFRQIDVIPNPITKPKIALPDRLPGDLIKPKIVTIGSTSSLKNVSSSLSAFRILRDTLPEAHLHLFGPGLDDIYVAGEPNVTGHGSVTHQSLMDFLANDATILVHPSRLESFGMAVTEAKARGVPVVAGRNSGAIPYVCDDGVSALVDIEDPFEISRATLELLRNYQAYEKARAVSSEDVQRRFSSESVTLMYETCYGKILAAGTSNRIK